MTDKTIESKVEPVILHAAGTARSCPKGETVGQENIAEGKIPVFACEGGCIRGEIARLAANMVAKDERYRRGCHGELFTVHHSAISQWMRNADKIVLIDGCFLKCHGRLLENIVDKDKIAHFDALSHYKKYSDLFDIDSVPEDERKAVARDVADWVLDKLENDS
jgi:uncharacterized metal-binding protein